MRSSWTDERMDDLNRKVDAMHGEMRSEFRGVCSEMDSKIDSLRTEMNARFDSLQRTMIAMMGTMVLGFASLLATQL